MASVRDLCDPAFQPLPKLEEARNEDLKRGDVIHLWCGTKRVVAIEPYEGPLRDIIFAICTYEPGDTRATGSITLERGGYTTRSVP
jgi:hypothetical protein